MMSFNSEPDAEYVSKFARRMETFWDNQTKQDDTFLALEQMRNRPEVGQMLGSTTPVKLLRAGTYGVLVDEEGALLTVTPFGHFNPLTDSQEDVEHASGLMEPWLTAAMKRSQKAGKVFTRMPRAMRSLGRAWSFCAQDPPAWAGEEYDNLLKELEEAKGDRTAAEKRLSNYRRDNFPISWRYVATRNTWTYFSGRHWLPEVTEIRKLGKEEIADAYPDLDLTDESGTDIKVIEYANHQWCMTVVGDKNPKEAYKWKHGLGMNPYCLMESELMPENGLNVRWRPAGFYARDLIEMLDELLSELRHNHEQNTLTPLIQYYDKNEYDEDAKIAGHPAVEKWQPGGTYARWIGEEPKLAPVAQINQQSIFLVGIIRSQIQESFVRPVQRGESKSGDAANLVRTQSQMADREFDPAMQAIKEAWEYNGRLHMRAVTALNRAYPDRPDKLYAGGVEVGPEDVAGWEFALQARAERAVPIDRNSQAAVAQQLLNMNVDPKTVFEEELGYEDSASIIRQANRYRLRQALFDQVVIPGAIQRATVVNTTATPQQQQQIQELFTGASPALQQVLQQNGQGPQPGAPGGPTIPMPGNMAQAQSNEARTGLPQAPQTMRYGGG